MLYLDLLLYIVIIILLIILINKILHKKEGFEHRGNEIIYTPKITRSVIKSAVYGSFINGPTDCIDVKPILDTLIASATESIVVSHNTFKIDDPASGEAKYLIINFTTPNVIVTDANFKMPVPPPSPTGIISEWDVYKDGWAWVEGDSVALNFGNGEEKPAWLGILSIMYKTADLFAYVIIRMPYKFLSKIMTSGGDSMGYVKDVFSPIIDFIKEILTIVRDIYLSIFEFVKSIFRGIYDFIRDLPSFLKSNFRWLIDFFRTVFNKFRALFTKTFDIVKAMFKALMQIPMTIFDIFDKLLQFGVNIFMIIIQIPMSALNMIIGLQDIMMNVMTKSPRIPFIDSFFQ
jgi:phage-related protein